MRIIQGRGIISGSNRVKRGGSWNNSANNMQVGNWNNNNPYNENNNIGFRFASTGAFMCIELFTDNSTSKAQVQAACPAPVFVRIGQIVYTFRRLVGYAEGLLKDHFTKIFDWEIIAFPVLVQANRGRRK